MLLIIQQNSFEFLPDSREPRDKRSGIFPEKQWNNCYVTLNTRENAWKIDPKF